MIRRAATRIVLALVAGAILTVAVAWGCAAVLDPYGRPTRPTIVSSPEVGSIEVLVRSGPGATVTLLVHRPWNPLWGPMRGTAADDVPAWFGAPATNAALADLIDERGARHAHFGPQSYVASAAGSFRATALAVDGRGWPRTALWLEYPVVRRGVVVEARGGLVMGNENRFVARQGGARPRGYDPVADAQVATMLPLRPAWSGFAVNTIVFAALVLVAWLAPARVLGFTRRLRGRCPGCGYPAGHGVICSECGARLRRGAPDPDPPRPPGAG